MMHSTHISAMGDEAQARNAAFAVPPILAVKDLRVEYHSTLRGGVAVDGLSFDLAPGEALTLVGESGCGKSTTALALMGLLPRQTSVSGQINFEGRDFLALSSAEQRVRRGRDLAMVFQDPMTSFNPVYTIGWQIAEILQAHAPMSRRAARARALELLAQVALPNPHQMLDAYPHQLSGGQRQRAMIAMAIALGPRLLIADEPTTALDSTTQLQILELIDDLRRDMGMSLLMISHDLPLVQKWSDRVIVMHHGRQIEALAAEDLFATGHHVYTKGLIAASLRLSDARHYTQARLPEIGAEKRPDGTFDYQLRIPEAGVTAESVSAPKTVDALSLLNVSIRYPEKRDMAVKSVSLTLPQNHTLGLVGESGSGKSSLSRAIMRLLPIADGQISLFGQDMMALKGSKLQAVRQQIQMVFQDPYSSLNPRQTVGDILRNILQLHGISDREKRIARIIDHVGLPQSALSRLPHEFSGGQRQRIGIARALILQPRVLICDEPVSALDVSIQAQILNLLSDLRAEYGLSMLFISHDLAVVQYISDSVAVMCRGEIVEHSDHNQIWRAPQHDYTRALIAAVN